MNSVVSDLNNTNIKINSSANLILITGAINIIPSLLTNFSNINSSLVNQAYSILNIISSD